MKNLALLSTVTLLAAFLDKAQASGGGGVPIGIIALCIIVGLCISFGLCVLGIFWKACQIAERRNSYPTAPTRRAAAAAPIRTAPAPVDNDKVRKVNLSNLPFCFVAGEFSGSPSRAVCERHYLECCKLGCHADYTLMNKLSASPGYQALKEDSEKLGFARPFVRDYFHNLTREPMPGGNHFPESVDKVISYWEAMADIADPVKVVHTFAGICYVKRCLPLSVKLANAATLHLQLLRVLTVAMKIQPPPPHFPAPPPIPGDNAAHTETKNSGEDDTTNSEEAETKNSGAWQAVEEEFLA